MGMEDTRFVIDDEGNRVGVFLEMEAYQRLLDAAEELESIRVYDAAKSSGDTPVPFEQAVAEIEKDRG